jgi:hypothetical protein
MKTPTRRGHGALILVVLIAMAIMLYLMFGSMGGKSYTQQISQTRKQGKALAQDINTQQLSILIAQYRQENNGKLPTSAADMENERAFLDPWNHPLKFSFSDERGQTKVTYHSNGPDGEANTEDDVKKTESLPY